MKLADIKAKAKSMFATVKAKVITAVGATAAVLGMATPAFAAEGDIAEATSAAETLMGKLTAVLNITNIVQILGAGLTAVVTLYLAWWGARKLTSMLQRAFAKGKISL